MESQSKPVDELVTTDPPVLLAVMIAANRTGNRMLERIAQRELERRHNLRVSFAASREGAAHV